MATAKTTATDTRETKWRKYLPLLVKDIKPVEIDLVIDICTELELDPLLGELIPFRGRPYITEAGLMKIANRSGELDGMNVDSEYADPDGRGPRWIATVTLYKKGCSQPFTFRADQLEYQNPSSGVWQKNKRSMTEKCCNCKTIRHAFEVSLPSIEEMAVNEYGITAEESQTEARAEAKAEAAESQAADHSARKEEEKQAKKEAKEQRLASEQTSLIGYLYREMGLKRKGAGGSEELFRNTYPIEKFPQLQTEQFMTTDQAEGYICKLYKKYGKVLQQKLELPDDRVRSVKEAIAPETKWPDMTAEQWNAYITAFKWAGVDSLSVSLGLSESQSVDMFNARFPDAKGRGEVSAADLDAYIAELQVKVKEAQTKPEKPEAEAKKEAEPPAETDPFDFDKEAA
jgi:hypothetical protein